MVKLNGSITAGVAVFVTLLAGTQALAQDRDTGWSGFLGVGVRNENTYLGSDKTETTLGLEADLTWNNLIFLRTDTGLGAYLINAERTGGNFSLGAAIGYDTEERLQADDPRLTGLNDIKAGPAFRVLMEYELGPADIELNLSRAIGSNGHEGLTAELSANFMIPVSDATIIGVSPSLTWANSAYMSSFYGVSAQEAASSRFNQYNAGSGIERIALELSVAHFFNDRFGLYGTAEYGLLQGDAKGSPISFDSSQTELGAGVIFRF